MKERYKQVSVTDTGKIFNTELLNAWELGNMLEMAEVIAVMRVEPHRNRAADIRARIIPKRDDKNWLKHTLAWKKMATDRDRLQAGDDHEISTQSTRLLVRLTMQITLKIFRYNPEVDKKFHYET